METWFELFAAGAQCGLLPDQVLSMTFPQFKAVLQGYEDRLFDLKCLTAYAGYWAGYYSNSKRPKPLSTILKELVENHIKAKKKKSEHKTTKPEVDIDEFIRREERFQKRLQRR